MNDNLVVLGPWVDDDRNEEWMVMHYDDAPEDDAIVVVCEGEKLVYDIDSDIVTLEENAVARSETLLNQFKNSQYRRMMEVTFHASGRTEVEGV